MINIALVRGHHLSKEETFSYELLKNEFNFTCFSTNSPWNDHSEIIFPIVQLPSTEAFFHFLPGNFSHKFFGFCDKQLGTGQWMPGLQKHLARFDIVHASDYCHLFTYQAARAKRELGYKLVAIHYENIPFARANKALVQLTKPTIYGEVDAFFAMSERARAALLLEGVKPQKIHVIGNAVDTQKFYPRPQENRPWRDKYGLKQDDIVILFIGRLHETKGVLHLVHAAKRLIADPEIDGSHVRILIAGRGNLEHAIRERISELELNEYVRLIGTVPHSEIHYLHNIADVFTLPSVPRQYWQEQFGIVLIESMACEKPVVSTLSGSIPEVVGDAGLLVQPDDHFSLYQGIKRLVVDGSLRAELGKRGRSRVDEIFSPRAVGDRLRDAYNSVLTV